MLDGFSVGRARESGLNLRLLVVVRELEAQKVSHGALAKLVSAHNVLSQSFGVHIVFFY